MQIIFSVPFGVFLLIWALVWEPKTRTKKDLKAHKALVAAGMDDGDDDWDDMGFDSLTTKQQRSYLRRVGQRILMLIGGILIIVVVFIAERPGIRDADALLLLFALYGGLMLVVQRADRTARLLVFFTMAFIAFLIWRTAIFRDYEDENTYALLMACVANLVFWLTIGQLYPPGNSDSIEVIGMEG